jgi:hypothetical protein
MLNAADANIIRAPWNAVLGEGAAILRYEAALIDGIIRGTRRTMRIAGHVVPVACCPGALASEVGNRLCKLGITLEQRIFGQWVDIGDGASGNGILVSPFSATYYDGADGKRHFSLRSPPGGADVGTIAQQMAARFNADWQELCTRDHDHREGCFRGGGHEHAAGFDAPIGWEGEA